MAIRDLAHSPLSDAALLDAVTHLAAEGRRVTVELVALLAALDARRLYLAEGYPSLFDFCRRRLRLSEAEAYHRIEAARAARCFPSILERLRAGKLTLTTVALLRPHLTEANHAVGLAWAEGRSKREVEVFVRTLAPRPDVRTSIRRLPQTRTSAVRAIPAETVPMPGSAAGARWIAATPQGVAPAAANAPEASLDGLACNPPVPPVNTGGLELAGIEAPAASPAVACVAPPAPTRPAAIRPLAPERYSLHVTISEDTYAKLRRAQALLRHADPAADAAVVLDRALALLVETLERKKFAALTVRPSRETPRARVRGAGRTRGTRPLADNGPARGGQTGGESTDAAEPGGPAQTKESHTPAPHTTSRVVCGDVSLSKASSPPRQPATPRPLRTIPAAVRREVWIRDGDACTYVGPAGRCGQTAGLEYHHRVPVADGGRSDAANLALLCVSHHRRESARWFGEDGAQPRTEAPRAANSVRTELGCGAAHDG